MIHQTPIISRVSNNSNKETCAHIDQHTKPETWQNALKNAFRDPLELLEYLKLPSKLIDSAIIDKIAFPMLVPRGFAQRMTTGDADDPLLLQVLPQIKELEIHSDYTTDPVGDMESMVIPGLLHKYHGRVLLTLTGACAIHCRYCFRRHFPYSDATLSSSNLTKVISYLEINHTINEVILSGGDPLNLSDRRLHDIIQQLQTIQHIEYLRIHTRLPIVLPERITSELLACLTSSRLKIIFVIHCNHPNELDEQVKNSLYKLSTNGIRLLNQSVLLRHVNDNVETLITLSKTLFQMDVTPYYLHLLDKVMGAQHFDLEISKAKKLFIELQNKLPGYLVPKLVQEISGKPSKVPVIPE